LQSTEEILDAALRHDDYIIFSGLNIRVFIAYRQGVNHTFSKDAPAL